MEYQYILLEVSDGVAQVTINRPEAVNSINVELARDLMYAAMRCDGDPGIRAVLVAGAGSMFCSGGDLKTFATQGDDASRYLKEVTTYLHAAVSRFTRMDPPVIAAVQGSAAGAGLSIVCAADFVFAAENAKFTMAYTRVGLTPDGSSTYFLSRIVGLRRALDLALTNRVLSAQEALDLGIVTRVVPEPQVLQEARALAAELAQGPTKAFGATKRLLHSGWSESLETQMELETRAICEMGRTADGREGMEAFLQKRKPNFRGQ